MRLRNLIPTDAKLVLYKPAILSHLTYRKNYQNKENSTSQETLACILDRLTKIEGRVDEITKKVKKIPQKTIK